MRGGATGLGSSDLHPLKHSLYGYFFFVAQNKDEFHLYYRKYLMKRLLHKGSSYSEEREQLMIRKLRVCVYLYG